MDTIKLKAFLAAEKCKSFSAAASEFSYTPSALSHMMDSLEAELGVKLFHRTHTGVEATEAGLQLKKYFCALIDAEQQLYEAAGVLSASSVVTLRIGTYHSIASQLLPELLNGFKQQYPHIKASIRIGDTLRTWLEEDLADIILSDVCPDGAVKWYPLLEEEYVAVVPSDCFPGRRSIRREELYAFPFIQTNESKLHSYFDSTQFAEIIQLESIEDTTTVSLVKERIGVAVLPHLVMKKRIRGVRILTLEPTITRSLGIAVKAGKLSGATAWFVHYLQEAFS